MEYPRLQRPQALLYIPEELTLERHDQTQLPADALSPEAHRVLEEVSHAVMRRALSETAEVINSRVAAEGQPSDMRYDALTQAGHISNTEALYELNELSPSKAMLALVRATYLQRESNSKAANRWSLRLQRARRGLGRMGRASLVYAAFAELGSIDTDDTENSRIRRPHDV